MADRATAVTVTGMAAVTAFGRGTAALCDAVLEGRRGFAPVTRFDVTGRRATSAAALDDAGGLAEELAGVAHQACRDAGLDPGERAACPVLLAAHAEPALVRSPDPAAATTGAAGAAVALAGRCGLGRAIRAYTTGCVAASSAVIDAAVMIRAGRAERILVAGGYLVDADYFGAFDAGRALSPGDAVRPFSRDRDGMLLGDAVAAVVVESAEAARRRGAKQLGQVVGWGRAGDAYHVCQPRPDGVGLARAVDAALGRAGVEAGRIGYVNAHGTGTAQSDAAETNALHRALGGYARRVPVSSTKSAHGHALEASALVELVATLAALQRGRLPVNAGFQEPDPECPLNLVLEPAAAEVEYALSVNAAFGGANTALVVKAGDRA
ncbi:beta-ketoacyl-[acyl-carrier-protein] synthase family protein [Micromonospora eburnea]|uniref:3-oxoacyl-(Acyl-carrier-protein) synthase n=1 Tax=Micromonospora eburnea TaxID=227316 RepID=A0A1C6V0R8_9ACTN|nr:beta-ketoacyl synthase N-terminal-like domain-containing protein [Micromonospora eburnea]SCL59704.1 3-oxoacyl-(acyl-carrier-protein) synthase [Micromonospora eburnea]